LRHERSLYKFNTWTYETQKTPSPHLKPQKGRADTVLVLNFPPLFHQKLMPGLGMKYRIPAIYFNSEFVESGG
jgi:hypothetical protein